MVKMLAEDSIISINNSATVCLKNKFQYDYFHAAILFLELAFFSLRKEINEYIR